MARSTVQNVRGKQHGHTTMRLLISIPSTHGLYNAWSVRRHTYGYLPSRRTLSPFDCLLLGDRGELSQSRYPAFGVEPARLRPVESPAVQRPNHSTTRPRVG